MKNNASNNLLKALSDCYTACNACTSACLAEKDVTMMAGCIRLNIDCAALCSLLAGFIARGSVHGRHLLKECTEVCGLCATECEKHGHMQHCAACAAACRACEQACIAAA